MNATGLEASPESASSVASDDEPFISLALAVASLRSMPQSCLVQVARQMPVVVLAGALLEGGSISPMSEDKAALLPAITTERIERWRRELSAVDVGATARRYAAAGVAVLVRGHDGYPAKLAGDDLAPPVLFARGDLSLLERRDHHPVAIVGTRSATRTGIGVARRFGRELSERGYPVVSGLALGIDGAAHEGALSSSGARTAGPIGVVASGLDVCYPRRHDRLWWEVTRRGVMVSPAPLGGAPAAHLFPKRNRVIAGLAAVTVVVESHHSGGSLITAHIAATLERTVLACPGALDNPAAEGTNSLIGEGRATFCRDLNDVLLALGAAREPSPATEAADLRPPPSIDDATVLIAMGWDPTSIDRICERTRQTLTRVVMSLARLEADGWAARTEGRWQRLGAPPEGFEPSPDVRQPDPALATQAPLS